MDRSLTYLDDMAAIRASLQLMQKRSGVPLVRFTSTFEVLCSGPSTLRTHLQHGRLSPRDPNPVEFPVFYG
jgi:hypothetical protein